MSFEKTRDRLLTASKTAEDLLSLISDLYVQEIHSKEQVLAAALAELHNSGEMDILRIVREIDKSSYGSGFFNILNIFENALPTLDARVEDVLHCLVHLTKQAGRDLAVAGVYQAFERYCSREVRRPSDSVRFILAQNELNSYASFLSSSILAYGSDYVVEAIQLIENLIANKNEVVRNQAYFSLGRLSVDESKANLIWDLISRNAGSENDNDCCASILTATLHFGESHPSYWSQVEGFLISFLKNGSTEVLYTISNIIAFRRVNVPKNILHLMVKQLSNASSDCKAIIDNIDHLLVRLVDINETSLAVDLLESILISGVEFKSLDYFSSKLTGNYKALRNYIFTKWFLYGEAMLCRSILDLLIHATNKEKELKAEMTILDNERKKVFVSRKAVGWLFTQPVAAADFILSISENSSINTIQELEDILYYPLLLSYPGELKDHFESLANSGTQSNLCKSLLEKYKLYHADLEKVSEIKELKAPTENLIAYWKDVGRAMQEAHEEASNLSFFQMFAKTQILLYGNSSSYYIHQSEGISVRQEVQMHKFSHATEIPRLNALDPVSLDYFLLTCRYEKLKNEANS